MEPNLSKTFSFITIKALFCFSLISLSTLNSEAPGMYSMNPAFAAFLRVNSAAAEVGITMYPLFSSSRTSLFICSSLAASALLAAITIGLFTLLISDAKANRSS
ncbi:103aa long hypothetical protein [Pyrococcus horikoshii OT3]|uniref:Uncharacterized protein n=1 Tax=Pyrococcus horikoshii (strain ATCC 700860 / DSM 12428 / JCM 9974 / NBRC 100139 / OT-3) TaxID=70601 RepID=O58262_PYRHO|nr:103aa long hypothetical protein [Pyrococcus horikoshii OT3]